MPKTTSSGESRFLGLPSTGLGRVSAWLFFASVVLMVLTGTVLESVSLSVGRLNIVGLVVTLVLLATLVSGAVALIRDRERSWVVWLATGLPAVILGFEVISLLIPGE